MAELVDALVSNTSGSNAVPVRSRLRVLKQSESESVSEHSRSVFSHSHSHSHFTETERLFILWETSTIQKTNNHGGKILIRSSFFNLK